MSEKERRRIARPNIRMQRTRSSPSALRSPLTRHPLGRTEIPLTFKAGHGAAS